MFARACNVGANSLNVVSRTFPHFSHSMLTPMWMLCLDHANCSVVSEQLY